MNTEELIRVLAADARMRRRPLYSSDVVKLVVGAIGATLLFLALIGVRADIAQAAQSIRFAFKLIVFLSAAGPAIGLTLRLIRPEVAVGRWGWTLVLAPTMLIFGVAAELVSTPSATWGCDSSARISVTV